MLGSSDEDFEGGTQAPLWDESDEESAAVQLCAHSPLRLLQQQQQRQQLLLLLLLRRRCDLDLPRVALTTALRAASTPQPAA